MLLKQQSSWGQNGEVQLKSKPSVAARLLVQIANLVKARIFWPGTRAVVGLSPPLGRLSVSVQCDDVDLSRFQGQLTNGSLGSSRRLHRCHSQFAKS